MFARRRGPRLVLAAVILLVALPDWRSGYLHLADHRQQVAYAVLLVANAVSILPLITGPLAASGARRGHRRGSAGSPGELDGTAVARPWSRAFAKYIGAAVPALLATLLLAVVMAALALEKAGEHDALLTLAAAGVMLFPAVLVTVALGLALGAVLPVRVAQALCAAIYFWALLVGIKGLPSIGHTPLDPSVAYARQVLFHTDADMSTAPFHPAASGLMLALNLIVLALAIASAIGLVAWRERPR